MNSSFIYFLFFEIVRRDLWIINYFIRNQNILDISFCVMQIKRKIDKIR
jgi:hypothetical protein